MKIFKLQTPNFRETPSARLHISAFQHFRCLEVSTLKADSSRWEGSERNPPKIALALLILTMRAS